MNVYNQIHSVAIKLFLIGLFAISSIVLPACSGDNPTNPQVPVKPSAKEAEIAITAIEPQSGYSGDTINIIGKGFSVTSANTVTFVPGSRAIVLSASTSQIVVVVPADAQTGPISVGHSGGGGTSPESFQVRKLIITDFYPKTADVGDTITITGLNFLPDASKNVVEVGGESAPVIEATSSRIRFIVSRKNTSGLITVRSRGASVTSTQIVVIRLLSFSNCIFSIKGISQQVRNYDFIKTGGSKDIVKVDTTTGGYSFFLDTRRYPEFSAETVERGFYKNRYTFSKKNKDDPNEKFLVTIELDPTDYSLQFVEFRESHSRVHWSNNGDTYNAYADSTVIVLVESITQNSPDNYSYTVKGSQLGNHLIRMTKDVSSTMRNDKVGVHMYEYSSVIDYNCLPDAEFTLQFVK